MKKMVLALALLSSVSFAADFNLADYQKEVKSLGSVAFPMTATRNIFSFIRSCGWSISQLVLDRIDDGIDKSKGQTSEVAKGVVEDELYKSLDEIFALNSNLTPRCKEDAQKAMVTSIEAINRGSYEVMTTIKQAAAEARSN